MSMTLLEVRQLHAKYGKRDVLRGVNLQICAGEWFCLIGPNGVGKSTLVRCIAGAVTPTKGELQIAGYSVIRDPVEAKRRLGFACAPEQLPGLLTGMQCLEAFAHAKGLRQIDADVLDLAGKLRFDRYCDHFVDTYSLGTRQKLCVLLALLGEPSVIVLDEAFNGLDPASAWVVKRDLQRRLAAGRGCVLLATHSLDIVEHYADNAALLIDGRIDREWAQVEIAALRGQGANAFEAALASAAGEQPIGT